MNLDSMSWRDYDEDGVPLWNEAPSPEFQEKMERDRRFRLERAKHEMPARDFPKDSEVNNDSLGNKLKSFVESFVGLKKTK